MEAFLYILRASPNPDRVERSVPFAVDDELVFFGPCKKNLRRMLRQRFLSNNVDVAQPSEPLYLVGFNGTGRPSRKIVWAGRITEIMTFAQAWDRLTGPRYAEMRALPESPLHLEPIREEGVLVGYRHATKMHEDDWVLDLVDSENSPDVLVSPGEIRVRHGVTAQQAFPRDACLLLENTFSAAGAGIDIDGEILGFLREAQPEVDINSVAVFGYQENGDVNGKRGWWLPMGAGLAERLVHAVKNRAESLRPRQRPIREVTPAKKCACEPTPRPPDPVRQGVC